MRFILALLLFTLGSWGSQQARAESISLQGEWRQIASNAGACADCSISIESSGSELSVTASNGWSAILQPDGTYAASGEGGWKPNFGGSYSGRPFLLRIAIVADKLMMVMSVSRADGRISHIKAAFEKKEPAREAI